MSFQAYLDTTEDSDRHVGTTGSHRDESDVLRLDGKARRGEPAWHGGEPSPRRITS